MPGERPFAVRFFDDQFRRQARERDFVLNPFERRALRHARGSVLDLGCGLGNFALEAARRGCRVLAVDGSPEGVRRVREAAAVEGLAVEAREVDLETTDVEGLHDVVVSIGVLSFFAPERARSLLRQVVDAVAPGGVAFVNVPAEGTTFEAMFDPVRRHLFAPAEVEAAFSGWDLLESDVASFPAPGDTVKVFSTVAARRPLGAHAAGSAR